MRDIADRSDAAPRVEVIVADITTLGLAAIVNAANERDRKSTRLNSSH